MSMPAFQNTLFILEWFGIYGPMLDPRQASLGLTSYGNKARLSQWTSWYWALSLTDVHTLFGFPQISPDARFLFQEPTRAPRYIQSLGSPRLSQFLRSSLVSMTSTV